MGEGTVGRDPVDPGRSAPGDARMLLRVDGRHCQASRPPDRCVHHPHVHAERPRPPRSPLPTPLLVWDSAR